MLSTMIRRLFATITAFLLRLREHFPLTLKGVVILLLMLLALEVFGYGSMDLIVFALTVCAITILLFSLFCVIFGGLMQQLRIRRLLQNPANTVNLQQVEAGYPNETGFRLPDLGFFPLIKLSWEVVYPDHIDTRIRHGVDNHELIEEIIPRKRCKSSRIVRLFTVNDVLGFCRYSWRQSESRELMALPRSNSLKSLPLLRSLTAEDGIPSPSGNPEGDRMEIRPYVPGDSVRNIMWKAYARNRQLNVRLPEKSVFHSNRTIAYLLSSEHDEAAAAVARVAVESGALGDDWLFSADGTESTCLDVPSALRAIATSRAIDEPFSYGLDDFLSQASAQSGTHCVVFTAAEPGPWTEQLKHTIARFRGQFTVILATDGMAEATRSSAWRRAVFRVQPGADQALPARTTGQGGQHPRAELGQLLTDLGQLVESAMLVDRSTGMSFDHSLRKV